jgi:hypothetical protein
MGRNIENLLQSPPNFAENAGFGLARNQKEVEDKKKAESQSQATE